MYYKILSLINMEMTNAHLLFLLLLLLVSGSHALEYTMEEELPAGTLIVNLPNESTLRDSLSEDDIQRLQYSFLSQPNTHSEYFSIDPMTGQLRTAQRIDRDAICPYLDTCELVVDVAIGPAQFFQVINIKITLIDINDNTPTFPIKKKNLLVSEGVMVGTRYTLPIAADPDSALNGLQGYELLGQIDAKEWELKATVGPGEVGDLQLVVKSSLDRETRDNYQLQIIARDGGSPALTGTLLINVTVDDANDNSPVFPNSTYIVAIPENATVNSSVLQVTAKDPDLGLNGQVVYGLAQRTRDKYGNLFTIDSKSGDIRLAAALDYEQTAVYHLSVTAQDQGTGSQQARAVVIVNVLDVNDAVPQIIVSTLPDVSIPQVSEAAPEGTFVAHVSALDQDTGTGGAVSCSMEGEGFTLEHLQKAQYKIMTSSVFDRETKDTYVLTLTCHDFGIPSLSSTHNVTVTVTDDNDHNPVFAQSTFYANIAENNQLNSFVLRVTATDRDLGSNSQIQYKLLEDSGGYFQVDSGDGIIRTSARLDYELMQEIQFHVVAQDGGIEPRSSTAVVIVTILDVNDNAPVFSASQYEFRAEENHAPGSRVGLVSAEDADDDPYNVIRFSLAPHVPHKTFSIDSTTGVIKTLRQLDREHHQEHKLTVYAHNPPISNDDVIMSSTVRVIVHVIDQNDNAPNVHYPSHTNHTLTIYDDVKVGEVITKIRAGDPDDGENGVIRFSVSEGNEDGAFDIEPLSGQIKVHRDLKEVEYNVYSLRILVSDSGTPPRMTWTSLTIFVNESAGAGPLSALTGTNKTIVISLTISFVFIIVVLVASICIVRSYDRRMGGRSSTGVTSKPPKTSIKVEVQKMFHMVHESPGGQSTTNSSLDSGSPAPRDSSSNSGQSKGLDSNKSSGFLQGTEGRPKQASQISQEGNHQTAVLPRLNGQIKRPSESQRNSGVYSAAPATDKDAHPHLHLQQQQQHQMYRDPRANNLYDSNCIYRAQQTPHPHHNHRLNPVNQRQSGMPVTPLVTDPKGPSGHPPSYSHIYKHPHLYHQLPQQQPPPQHRPHRTPDSIFDVSHKEMEIQRILTLMERGDGDTESTLSGEGSNTSNTDSGKGPSEEGEAVSTSLPLDSGSETVLIRKLRELGSLDFAYDPRNPKGPPRPKCNRLLMKNSRNRLHSSNSDSVSPEISSPQTLAQTHPTDSCFKRHLVDIKHGDYVSRDQFGRSSVDSLGRSSNGDIADDATTTSGSYVVDLDDVNSVDFNDSELQMKDSQV